MTTTEQEKKTLRQWARLAAIPLLVVVLIGVLCWPSGDSDATVEVAALAPNAAPTRQAEKNQPATSKWPKARLEEVIAFNPFEPPMPEKVQQLPEDLLAEADALERARADQADAPTSQRELPVTTVPIGKLQAIYFDTHAAAAIVDSKVLRVGDELPGGRRILEITAQGLKLEGPSEVR